MIEAHDRGDFVTVFAAYNLGIEWHIAHVGGSVGDTEPVYYGHEGVLTFWREWFAAGETASSSTNPSSTPETAASRSG